MKYLSVLALLTLGLTHTILAGEPAPTSVVLIDHAKIDAAFTKGLPLLANEHYKLLAGRRVTAGIVEVHDKDTDIFYVVEGSATLVTGGTLIEAKTTDKNEIRAKETTGGDANHLTKGDVIIIPKGVPHWFTEVSGTFLYFVVKVVE